MDSQLFDRMITFSPDMKKGTWQEAAEHEWDITTGCLNKKRNFRLLKRD